MSDLSLSNEMNGSEIAIIGLSGRFPGANDTEAFWQNLREGVESVSFFSDEELLSSGIDPTVLSHPDYVKAKAILSDIDRFDAAFFGFSPKEAELTDPQHRLFLESAWSALENAGYHPEAAGSIGVYAGVETNTYLLHNIYPNFGLSDLQTFIGNATDYLSTKVSYKLNLKGPSVTVQSACSTSLVAVHMASQSLLSGECDMALAGGISVTVPQKSGYSYQPGGIDSPDGHCRAFDARAQGTFFGNGVGIVVLKRLAEAIADRDCIHAVIKGSAINNDGALKVGYTAPSSDGQSAVIAEAQAIAGIDPETLTYIEAHGTGTALGDPIEMAALTQVFRHRTDKKRFCAIGSVKTNFGHLSIAAGVAGLIKTVLALQHKQIPPSLHFEQANPQIDFANSPFYVNAKLAEWKTHGNPRRAGVSSFGIGGTNAHLILEEAPPRAASSPARSPQLLVLSAKTRSALEMATTHLAQHLTQQPDLNLADVAYTLQVGRRGFQHRRMVVADTLETASQLLASDDPQRVFTHSQESIDRPVIFMFTGQGAQYVNMARELYECEPTFRDICDRCFALIKPQIGLDLRQVLYPDSAAVEQATQQLQQTAVTQPALFIIEYALAQLWMSWGIRPAAMIGHSIGEYVAACLSGVFSLEDALSLVCTRGQLMQQLPGGAMLSMGLPAEKIHPLLNDNLSLAASNSAALSVVSGSIEAIEALEHQLTQTGINVRRLHTSHAFHSKQMDAMIEPFLLAVKQVSLSSPQIPWISNVSGTWITSAEATNSQYWARHLRQTVQFATGIAELLHDPEYVFLEVGPGQTLSTFTKQQSSERIVLSSLRHPKTQQSDVAFLLNTLGRLWLSGVKVDWSGFYAHESRDRLPLPTYPFERQRYWIDPPNSRPDHAVEQNSLARKPDPADWFYMPVWKQSMPPVSLAKDSWVQQPQRWLVLVDECGVSDPIVQGLRCNSQEVVSVRAGEQFAQLSHQEYSLNPRSPEDYHALLQDLRLKDQLPHTIVHAWSIKPYQQSRSDRDSFEETQQSGFYSLLFLTQAISKQLIHDSIHLCILSNGLYSVESSDECYPEKSPLLGLCQVIPQEYTTITCRSIDLRLASTGSWQAKRLIDQLTTELITPTSDLKVAYRGHHRWVQEIEPVKVTKRFSTQLRQGGTYLITGGLGKLGLILAKYLAQTVQPKLVLLGRSGLPNPEEWSHWLATHDPVHDPGDRVSLKIAAVQELESLGANVLVISADVSNETQMQAAIARAEEKFGEIHGVIHAAGIVESDSFKAISEIGYAECELHFKPKVHGLYTLKKVLQGKTLDFCLLTSSISSILGGLGFAAYSAANIFLDAFAHQQNSIDQSQWCSINWFSIDSSTETIEAFQRILSNELMTQVAISQVDLKAQMNRWIQKNTHQTSEKVKDENSTSSSYSRSNQLRIYVAPGTEVESRIAERYQQLLGIEQVGIYDNFFDLGGHSLIGTQLITQLRQDFQLELPITLLFECPSVEELALAIEDILIRELEDLSEAEARQRASDIPFQAQMSD